MLSCEKDDTDYPEYRGDHIYTANAEPTWGESPISTLSWISDDELAVFEGSRIKIIDIQSHTTKNTYDAEKDIEYSVISDNRNFIYFFSRNSFESCSLYRLNLTSGSIDSLLNIGMSGDMRHSGICVSPDESTIAYKKTSFSNGSLNYTIVLYEIATGNEVELIEGNPILFTNDNSELLYSKDSPFSICSYNLESGESKVVLSDQNINFQNSNFYPSSYINAVKGDGNIFLTLAGTEDDFLIYNLTEANPIFLGAMEPYDVWKHDNLKSYGYKFYGCNFAIDTRNMKLHTWAFDCVEKIWEGWSYTCSPYRYNLSTIDLISKERTRTGNVLNKLMGTTAISPDGTKLAYLSGIPHTTNMVPQFKYVYVYNLSD